MERNASCPQDWQKDSSENASSTPQYHIALERRCRDKEIRAHAALQRAHELMNQTRNLLERSRKKTLLLAITDEQILLSILLALRARSVFDTA